MNIFECLESLSNYGWWTAYQSTISLAAEVGLTDQELQLLAEFEATKGTGWDTMFADALAVRAGAEEIKQVLWSQSNWNQSN